MVISIVRVGAITTVAPSGFIKMLVILADYSLHGIALLGPDTGMLFI